MGEGGRARTRGGYATLRPQRRSTVRFRANDTVCKPPPATALHTRVVSHTDSLPCTAPPRRVHESNETATGAPAAPGSHTLIRAMLQPADADADATASPPAAATDPSTNTDASSSSSSPPPPAAAPWPVGSAFRYLSSDPVATGGHLAVEVRRRDGQSATVALCRFTAEVAEGAEDGEQCYNGLGAGGWGVGLGCGIVDTSPK